MAAKLTNYGINSAAIHITISLYKEVDSISQQNGSLEEKHLHILNVTRALTFEANFPTKYSESVILEATI